MTLLPDQPAPTPGSGDLWREVIDSALAPDNVLAMCEERRRLGIERYGTPLQRDNGRDFRVDLVQELLDAAVYAHGAGERRLVMVLLDVVAGLVPETGE